MIVNSLTTVARVFLTLSITVAPGVANASEVGANDFRISDMGPDGDVDFRGSTPSIAYNSQDHEYLVVFNGIDLPSGETEVYGRRLDGATGAPLGATDFRISNIGPEGNDLLNGLSASVAYNSADNEYLVSFWGDAVIDQSFFQVFAQRLNAAGEEIGANDFRISDVTGQMTTVVYNSVENEYFVIWMAESEPGTLDTEVFGQRLSATGEELGPEIRISHMSPAGDDDFLGIFPSLAYNSIANEYLVVWHGRTEGINSDDLEVFGQRLDGATGAEVGTDDFRISSMGDDAAGNFNFIGADAAVAFNGVRNEYLVVWRGTDDPSPGHEREIYGQRLDALGNEIGTDDVRISHVGPDGNINFGARSPAVTYNSLDDEYLVVWQADDGGSQLDEELEIYTQRIDGATGEAVGPMSARVSDQGPDRFDFDALSPAAIYNPVAHEYLVVWHGDDNLAPLVDGELEIFGQRLDGDASSVDLTMRTIPAIPRIPAIGGSFDFVLQVENLTNEEQTIDFWNTVTLESGQTVGPVFGPFTVTLGPGEVVNRRRTQAITAAPGPGVHTFTLNVGSHPDVVSVRKDRVFQILEE